MLKLKGNSTKFPPVITASFSSPMSCVRMSPFLILSKIWRCPESVVSDSKESTSLSRSHQNSLYWARSASRSRDRCLCISLGMFSTTSR